MAACSQDEFNSTERVQHNNEKIKQAVLKFTREKLQNRYSNISDDSKNFEKQDVYVGPINQSLQNQENYGVQENIENEEKFGMNRKIDELEKKLGENVEKLGQFWDNQIQSDEKSCLSKDVAQILKIQNDLMDEFQKLKTDLVSKENESKFSELSQVLLNQENLLNELQEIKNKSTFSDEIGKKFDKISEIQKNQEDLLHELQGLKNNHPFYDQIKAKFIEISEMLKNQEILMDEFQGLKNNLISDQIENKLDDILNQLQENGKNDAESKQLNEIINNIHEIKEKITKIQVENRVKSHNSDKNFFESSSYNKLLVKSMMKLLQEKDDKQKFHVDQSDETNSQLLEQNRASEDINMPDMQKMQDNQLSNADLQQSEFNLEDLHEVTLESVEEIFDLTKIPQFRIILKIWAQDATNFQMIIPYFSGQQLSRFLTREIDENRMMYKVFQTMIKKVGLNLEKMVICEFRNRTYVCKLEFRNQKGEIWSVEMRPSDGLNITLRFKSPIFISKCLVQK